MTTQGKLRLKIWLVVVSVFALGVMSGAFLNSAFRLQASDAKIDKSGKTSSEERLENLRRNLNLDERQAGEVKTIIEKTRTDYRALKAEVEPRYDAIRQSARQQIRAVLNEAQQKRFDEMVAERDAHRENKMRHEK
jgi:uncharacterized membrane protein